MPGLAVHLIDRQTRETGGRLALILWPACIEPQHLLKRIGLRQAVGIKDPNPVETFFECIGETGAHVPARTEMFRVTNNRGMAQRWLTKRIVGRAVIYYQDCVDGMGLPLNRRDRLVDD